MVIEQPEGDLVQRGLDGADLAEDVSGGLILVRRVAAP
jgi:hypothetical protein